ncbi:membrane protease YdiL (CAAX protease family) [Nocardiopsis mwathae]|uniref:Membrane protease YdiL (CAAX protease family) n=1 Tax=Nocardiopsis mwathae TaxID=1472723 RepID=A0A7X0D3J1_9ACTN|nr:CPBP family intramembrane glutamic endopeptidase [Nocardiopsis mwathae]MBB6170253.1 membrane protease YdiL (CAAX protease family) [Nocardiopsis mwathae]
MILGIALMAYAAVGEPILGRIAYAWLRRRRETDASALVKYYGLTIAIQWLWIAAIVAILVTSPGLGLDDLGLRAPDKWAPFLAALVGFGVGGGIFWLLTRDRAGKKDKGRKKGKGAAGGRAADADDEFEAEYPGDSAYDPSHGPSYEAPHGGGYPSGPGVPPAHGYGTGPQYGHGPGPQHGGPSYDIGATAAFAPGEVPGHHSGGRPETHPDGGPRLPPAPAPGAEVNEALAPRTPAERRLAAALAITAGIGEELLYRGLFIALGVSFGLPLWAAAILSCVLFAIAHLYQGWWGLVGPGLVGVLFTVVYLGTGSLIIPILLHIALDVRSLLISRGSGGGGGDHGGRPADRGARKGRRGGGRRGGDRGHARAAGRGGGRRDPRDGAPRATGGRSGGGRRRRGAPPM